MTTPTLPIKLTLWTTISAFVVGIVIGFCGAGVCVFVAWKTEGIGRIRMMDPQLLQLVVSQRDDLSRRANKLMRQFMKEDCEKKIQISDSASIFGGWCQAAASLNGSKHRTDDHLIAYLSEFLSGKSVASFGDGPGIYKRRLDALATLASYAAYDGAPNAEEASGGLVTHLDLTLPAFGLPAYDWVLSLEVGEHIPKEFEDIYLDTVTRHAREGVILSWGRPGQRGVRHVNNRAVRDVIAAMSARGFVLDDAESKIVKARANHSWFKRNANVYRRWKGAPFQPLFT